MPCFFEPWDAAARRSPRLQTKSYPVTIHCLSVALSYGGIRWPQTVVPGEKLRVCISNKYLGDKNTGKRQWSGAKYLQEARIWGQIPSRSKDLGSNTFNKQGSGAKYLLFQFDPIKLRNRLLLWSGPLKGQVSIRYFPIMYWQWDLPAKELYSETSGFSTPPLPCLCLKQRPQGLVCSQNSWRYRQKTRGRKLLTTRGSFQRPGLPEVPHITSLPLLLSVSAEAYVRSDCATHVIY